MSIDTAAPPTPKKLSEGAPPAGRVSDTAFRYVAFGAAVLVFVILALIAWSTTKEAWPAFRFEGLSFFTSKTWDPAHLKFGGLAFVYGTVISSFIALVFGVPVSLGIALFVTEVAPQWLRRPVIYVVDLLATIPSVAYGLWGILVLAPAIQGFYQNVADFFSGVPVLGLVFSGNPVVGRNFMTAGLILAVMIVPIVTSISRVVFATVPTEQKEAAYGLGATRWEMIRGAVLPHSRNGIVAGVMIGLGRALGETIAVALVIGSSAQVTARMFSSGDAMAAVIANQFGEAFGTQRSALFALGVCLFILTLLVNVLARAVVSRSGHEVVTGAVR
jgi:phosphate transport system permease protein